MLRGVFVECCGGQDSAPFCGVLQANFFRKTAAGADSPWLLVCGCVRPRAVPSPVSSPAEGLHWHEADLMQDWIRRMAYHEIVHDQPFSWVGRISGGIRCHVRLMVTNAAGSHSALSLRLRASAKVFADWTLDHDTTLYPKRLCITGGIEKNQTCGR